MNKRPIRVLWISNITPISIDNSLQNTSGGWLAGAFESIKNDENIQLSLAFPVNSKLGSGEVIIGRTTLYKFSLPLVCKLVKSKTLDKLLLSKYINNILKKSNPDILHIFGTEFLHTRVVVECFNRPEKTIIHIQGIVSVYAKHCTFGFPNFIKHLFIPSSIIKGTINGQMRKWRRAGKDEISSINNVKFIMGRTEWDEACTKQINPSVNYIHCGETLRSSFYEELSQWKYEGCKKHSIYFSQSSSQVKGLHLVLPILPELIKRYPDVHLYIGGNNPIGKSNIKGLLRRSPLGWYLKHQIKKYKLDKYVTFLGVQNEQEVVQNLKNGHVFLSASLIENSPNSIGEALVVGTPVVSSDVGGVKDFISHGKNGFIYPVDEPYMIPYYISKIFDNDQLAEQLSQYGKELGMQKYSIEKNRKTILETYYKIPHNL